MEKLNIMKYLMMCISFCFAFSSFAQLETRPICDDVFEMPTALTYSGFIIYDEDQDVNVSNNINLRVNVISTDNGLSIFNEAHTIDASKTGFFSITIGEKNRRNFEEMMSAISDNNGTSYAINVSMLGQNSPVYKLIGTKEILTVPYALVASSIGGMGNTGPAGADSTVQGEQGGPGPQGPQGPAGPQGRIGEQGPQGVDGFGIMPMRSTVPNNTECLFYIDDGTNTADGLPHMRYYDNNSWIDL